MTVTPYNFYDREIGLPPLNAARETSELCRHCEHPLDWHLHDRAIDPPCQVMDRPTSKKIHASGLVFQHYPICFCPGWEIQDGVQDVCVCCDHDSDAATTTREHSDGATVGGTQPPAPQPVSGEEALRLPASASTVT